MRLTTKGRFAVTAMIDVAMNSTQGPATLAGVSERQKISLSYLEQLFGKLRRHGLVESVRGPGGGYHLGRPADAMSVADIILAVDEPIDATQCGGRENCHDDRRCMTHELWAGLNAHIFNFLRSVTLAQLVAQQQPESGEVAVLQDRRPNNGNPSGRARETAPIA
jgi:Rrf2 family transcriptional regulator, iron-sulfur cluster assembly transcription factor